MQTQTRPACAHVLVGDLYKGMKDLDHGFFLSCLSIYTLAFQHLSHKHREGCTKALDTHVHPG